MNILQTNFYDFSPKIEHNHSCSHISFFISKNQNCSLELKKTNFLTSYVIVSTSYWRLTHLKNYLHVRIFLLRMFTFPAEVFKIVFNVANSPWWPLTFLLIVIVFPVTAFNFSVMVLTSPVAGFNFSVTVVTYSVMNCLFIFLFSAVPFPVRVFIFFVLVVTFAVTVFMFSTTVVTCLWWSLLFTCFDYSGIYLHFVKKYLSVTGLKMVR